VFLYPFHFSCFFFLSSTRESDLEHGRERDGVRVVST
jgi:hypothetical protein